MIFGLRPEDFAALMALFFTGTIVLVPVLALSARLALKPLTETLLKLRQGGNEAVLQDRRIALLEAEVQHLATLTQQVLDAGELRHPLGAPSALPVEHHA